MHFTTDGGGVLYCGTKRGEPARSYLIDLASGVARPVTPEGTNRAVGSPNGKDIIARAADGCFYRYPLDGGSPATLAGLEREDVILGFRPDAKSVLAVRFSEMPARIASVDLATGQRTNLREIAPENMIGCIVSCGVDFSEDENSYVYSIGRSVDELFSVELPR
jgi:hypothetical protein